MNKSSASTPPNHVLGPSFISLQVRDLDASKRFYVERLGLAVIPGPPHAVVFDTKPIPFAVREPLIDLDQVTHLGSGVAMWFAAEDADALHRSLADAGVMILAPVTDGPFGRVFTFRDPDGYAVTVHTASKPSA
jgi:predicted enzyme related to lactoylglutathione lyase